MYRIQVATFLLAALSFAQHPHHDIKLSLQPQRNEIQMTDTISWPKDSSPPTQLLINKRLEIVKSSVPLTPIENLQKVSFYSINSGADASETQDQLAGYEFKLPEGTYQLTVSYKGNMHFVLSDQKEEYARGFRETMASLSEEGVYFSGRSYWYPHFENELMTFQMQVQMPSSWHVISQGSGHSEMGMAKWSSEVGMDEIYLVGGPLTLYAQSTGTVEAQVYLRQADPALADKYLEATAQYIEMYRSLIGPYPYDKFALVENFWETGYGMPSFTLLGPRVIRMPFILHSSYPHEILHNWWGNSVFVDYESGNWCEGLTAYEADHLIKEQRGQGAAYRKSTLQKYRNYAASEKDFPISEFRSRHSASTEAIGYGKTLMVFHMLRKQVGDDTFNRSLARFFRANKGKKASFDDLKAAFESTAEVKLDDFFEQWIQRSGAPNLELSQADVALEGASYKVTGTLKQVQEMDVFQLNVPILVQFRDSYEIKELELTGRTTAFEWRFDKEPVRLIVDPSFDTFRLLDPREIPSSIGKLFGSPSITVLLPSEEKQEKLDAYRKLFENWSHDGHQISIKMDTELDKIPENETIWIASLNNRHLGQFLNRSKPIGFDYSDHHFRWKEKTLIGSNTSLVVTVPTADHDHAWGLIDVNPTAAFNGMGRKLPHYGKYSYLAFEGEEPTNIHKGQWATDDSPMVKTLAGDAPPPVAPKPAKALAELPSLFSTDSMKTDVAFLASEELEGRAPGTAGIDKARDYIEAQFKKAGLAPGLFGSFRQDFEMDGPDGNKISTSNLIGVIPGQNMAESVLITAHYDHLGRGWPDVHKGDEGKIHFGADDNASGVALLLEYAKSYAKQYKDGKPKKNIVFVAFSGEESGRLGSQYFVKNPPLPLNGIMGVINMDTIGRLGNKKLKILGTGSAAEWVHIFRGCGFVTGLANECVPGLLESSDQMSFVQAGVPAVQIFSGAHPDYHRPTDTVEKIDWPGMVKVATFVREAINYLVDRDEPLTFTGKVEAAAKPKHPGPGSKGGSQKSSRRVSFGSIPDMAFQGPGVKLTGTMPDSPAAKAGLKAGDILVRMADQDVTDLRAFSNILKSLEPGQTVPVEVQRGEERIAADVTVVER